MKPVDSLARELYFREVESHPLLNAKDQFVLAKRYAELVGTFRNSVLDLEEACVEIVKEWRRRKDADLMTGKMSEEWNSIYSSSHKLSVNLDLQLSTAETLILAKKDVAQIKKHVREANVSNLVINEIRNRLVRQYDNFNDEFRHAFTQVQLIWEEMNFIKAQFVSANLRLVISVAKGFTNTLIPLEDLIQEGNIGLVRAVEKYDPDRGIRFSTYAIWWVRQAIHRCVETSMRIIRLPAHLQDDLRSYKRTVSTFEKEFEREPSREELMALMGISEEQLNHILHSLYLINSLDMPAGIPGSTMNGNRSKEGQALIQMIRDFRLPDPNNTIDSAIIASGTRKLLDELTEREKVVLSRRFGIDSEEHTLEEIGQMLGVSRERVRQIEAKALIKLREIVPAHLREM